MSTEYIGGRKVARSERQPKLICDEVAAAGDLGHHVSTVTRERTDDEIARWKAGDAERNERARRERLRRDGARSPSENLAEGIALARFAHLLAAAPKRPKG